VSKPLDFVTLSNAVSEGVAFRCCVKELAGINFPISRWLWDSAVVPFRE
jgi:hypothetical protein